MLRERRRSLDWLGSYLGALAIVAVGVRPAQAWSTADAAVERLSRSEILGAMRQETGYDFTTTTNAARFQAQVLFRLASVGSRCGPAGRPWLIDHEDWYRAFLAATGLAEDEAPIFAHLAYQHHQDLLVDCGPGRVLREVGSGEAPALALNVTLWWSKQHEAPQHFSYEDTLSTPQLKVTYHRLMRYRLLDFGERLVYDEIEGLSGRPTTGLLSLLFRLIGEARIRFSRIAVSEDGLQILYAKASKGPLSVASTVTVRPDGVAEKGLPPDRPDLDRIEARLKRDLDVEYVPWDQSARAEALSRADAQERSRP